jgi:TfoX/Sxy family transcriptional regulator of competence genes
MVVNADLAARVRGLVAGDPRVTEKKMFGGICFLLDGKILVAARRTGNLMAQVGAEAADRLDGQAGVARMVMKGKPTAAFLDIETGLLESDEELRRWIELAERYVAAKP